MSLLSWLFPTHQTKKAATRPAASVLPRGLAVEPPSQVSKQLDELAKGRAARREKIFSAVRHVMLRANVLSSGYKFKVLSLDQRGSKFLVMIDLLLPEYARDTTRLVEIETQIIGVARQRANTVVTAVYWRVNEQAVTAQAVAAQPPSPAPTAPILPAREESAVAPPLRASGPASAAAAMSDFEPVEPDEITAFKQALANAMAQRPPKAPPPLPARQTPVRNSRLPLPGFGDFEDTQQPVPALRSPEHANELISSTQYGSLS